MNRRMITSQIYTNLRTPIASGSAQYQAAFSPSDFVVYAIDNEIECSSKSKLKYFRDGRNQYTGMPYVSGAMEFGGGKAAAQFRKAITVVLEKNNLGTIRSFLGVDAFDDAKIFTGAPKLEHVSKLVGLVLDYDEDFKNVVVSEPGPRLDFASFYQGSPSDGFPVYEMRKKNLWGMDCIGFVGRYLEAAGVTKRGYQNNAYLSWAYANFFTPIKSIDEAEDLCVGVACNGKHVVIIDSCSVSGNTISALICQSAGGGVQMNEVTFRAGDSHMDDKKGESDKGVLDFGSYFVDTGKPMEIAWLAYWGGVELTLPNIDSITDAKLKAVEKKKRQKLKADEKAAFEKNFKAIAKAKDSLYDTSTGYKGGQIFMLSGAGSALASGLFYVCKLGDGIKKLY